MTIPRGLRDAVGLVDEDLDLDDSDSFREQLLNALANDPEIRALIHRIVAEDLKREMTRGRSGGRRG